ncbi:hypothetical protein [Gillisia sp. Hel_I_29]|uniref:hypothetical protein n=1 Tax=Gillisia sp. Hel_I_29 TaxID=1249975 RepID=UPI0005570AFA|nr:hypothetical protein [Gillisia sp. Hel_I_29]
MKIIYLIVPGLIAIIGNIIFYLIIKKNVDQKIEKFKVAYSGVFREKLEIHKTLLKKLFDLKSKIQQFQYNGSEEMGIELRRDFNDFIKYYIYNQPFIKKEILAALKEINKELQSCFEEFFMHHSLKNVQGLESKIRKENLAKFFEAGDKFKSNGPFITLEELLINEIKKDLKIEHE